MSRELSRPDWANNIRVRAWELELPRIVSYVGPGSQAVPWCGQMSRQRFQINDGNRNIITLDVAQAKMVAAMITYHVNAGWSI